VIANRKQSEYLKERHGSAAKRENVNVSFGMRTLSSRAIKFVRDFCLIKVVMIDSGANRIKSDIKKRDCEH
jgi:hypothetical protein